eukprot:TRINITY_DN23000_c0_g1_i1.p1 TRINITY_DN23000_c0_g1~~TRINITY_DN23000_c0_g1_i1.p1  ORF type:complete len:339 (+),score=100.15 TRINITY_DN23000_c0_g1_i1:72-1019(+)
MPQDTAPTPLREVVGDYTKNYGARATLWAVAHDRVCVIGDKGSKYFTVRRGPQGEPQVVCSDAVGTLVREGDRATLRWSSGGVWAKDRSVLPPVGPHEQRDLDAVPLGDHQREGRASYRFTSQLQAGERELMGAAERAVACCAPPQLLRGANPNVYYEKAQGKWRGHAGFVYYPPSDAFKVCLSRRHPSHDTFRNMYHGTTFDRLSSILEGGLQLSGVGPAEAQNPYRQRHVGRIFTSPQFSTALGYSHPQELPCARGDTGGGRTARVVLKCLQDPSDMIPLEDPAACGFDRDGDYFYTVRPESIVVFAVLVVFC